MSKAYVFPGQGAQFPGMGKAVYDGSASARQLFQRADSILGYKISDIMFNGTEDDLRDTRITQPATYLHSVILARCLDGFHPDMVAGHSLGEFSALVAAGAMTFDDGLVLVAKRAEAMQRCCKNVPGTMAAVLGLSAEVVEQACQAAGGIVVPANYNSDSQIVISGEANAVQDAAKKCEEAGALRVIPLNVGGAFHSPLMEPAGKELSDAIQATRIVEPSCPVYQNYTSLPEKDPTKIKANLLAQLTGSVKWTQSIRHMLEDGATSFTSVGPGNALVRLIKTTAKSGYGDTTVEAVQELPQVQ